MTSTNSAKKRKRQEELTQDPVLQSVLNTYSDHLMTQTKKCVSSTFRQLKNKNQIDSIYNKKDIKEYSFIVYNEKDKQSQNAASKVNKKKARKHDNVENLKSSHESKWNKMPLSKPLLSSTRLYENMQVQNVTNTKQSQNSGRSRSKSDTSRMHLAEDHITSAQLTNTGSDPLNNELTKKFTHSTFSLSDINDLGSLRNTQDLYMQVEQAICEGRNSDQRNVMQAGVHHVKPSNTVASVSANPGHSILKDVYQDLSELSSMPDSQEIFDWIKNSDSEESASLNRLLNLNHDEFSHIKLKQALKEIKNKKKNVELKFGKNLQVQNKNGDAQEKCAISSNDSPLNTDSQELNMLNDELANFLNTRTKNIKDTSLVHAKERNSIQENIKPIAKEKESNKAKSDKALFEPPKAPSNSSYSQECAIEDLTNNSILKSLRSKTKTLNGKTNILNPLNIQINQEKELPAQKTKKSRRQLYSAERAAFLNTSIKNLDKSIIYEEKGLTQKFGNKHGSTSQISRFSSTETKTLLKLIEENDRYKRIKTKTFWEEVARLWIKKNLMTKSLNARNSVSLRKHYYNRILPNLYKFDLPPDKITSLQYYSMND